MNVFAGVACRECGLRTLHLEWRAGGRAMLRHGTVAETEWPWCVCYACGAERPGMPPEAGAHNTTVDLDQPAEFYDRVFRRD